MDRPLTPPAYSTDPIKTEHGPDDKYSSPTRDPNSPPKKRNLYERICYNLPFQISCRAFQCIASIISTILFALRLKRLADKVVDTVTASNGAVMGILAAAVVYDVTGLIIRMALKNGGPMYLRFVWVIADIMFIVAFIMVAELTAPGRKMTSGPCHTTTHLTSIEGTLFDIYNELNCKLPLGTFILAIFNVILHTVTAVFNQAKEAYEYYKNKRDAKRGLTT